MTAAEIEAGTQVECQTKKKYSDKIKFVNAIAQPLASKKLNKKLMKLCDCACQDKKKNMRVGLKDVQRHIRKGETGLMIFAGDVSPIDIMCHMPGVCEELNIPYCYVPSQHDLAEAVGFKNSCLMALIKEDPSYKKQYNDCYQEIKTLVHPM